MLNSLKLLVVRLCIKRPNRIDEIVEAALNENVPTVVDVHVDPNTAVRHYQVKSLTKKHMVMVNGLTDLSQKTKEFDFDKYHQSL